MTGSGLGPGGKGRRCLDVFVISQVTNPMTATTAKPPEYGKSGGLSMPVHLAGRLKGLEVASEDPRYYIGMYAYVAHLRPYLWLMVNAHRGFPGDSQPKSR